MSQPEAWLRGPFEGVAPMLMPASHALVQASEDLERAVSGLTVEQLWVKPGGAASVGFHLRHIAGSIDRLLTYARGEQLTEAQRQAMPLEQQPGDPPADAAALVREAQAAIERALAAILAVRKESLFDPRAIGRQALPTNVFGLLCHIAEHAQRHTGQIITTVKIVRSIPGR
jgi:uncharacterized damage-inducible protein DinB